MNILISIIAPLIVFALGCSIGSFLNVVIYRLPAGLSILWPPSRCPHCLHQLGKSENIPVFGWIRLKGRCAHCQSSISIRYPVVEGITGILFLLVFYQFGLSWQTLGDWTFISWLLALGLIDVDTMTLPNPLTKSGLVIGLGFQAGIGWATTHLLAGTINGLMSGVIGAVLGIWLFDIITLVGTIAFGQAAMGGGDVKLAAMMGVWLGWKYLLLASFIACAIGAFAGGAAIALGWIERRQPMPFGPFLALGAALTMFFGQAILDTYIHFFFPLS